VWRVSFNPVIGSEADGSEGLEKDARPAVIVSNNGRNRASERTGRGVVTVVPLTTNTARVLDFQALIVADESSGLGSDSKAQAEQVRALDVSRFVRRMGVLSREQMAAIDEALLVHLDLH
jgi:mRNA interferase MazF